MKTALVLEDNSNGLDLLVQVLRESFAGIDIRTATNIEACLNELKSYEPEIALIDLALPDGSGIDVIRYLKSERKDTYVVVTTIFDDSSTLFSALRAGADGYVLKYQTPEMIVDLLQGIAKGNPPLSPEIAKKILLSFASENNSEPVLSDREQEVLQLIGKGFTVKKVSELLGISKNTTSFHIKSIYKKLNVNSRAEATIEAAKMGIIKV